MNAWSSPHRIARPSAKGIAILLGLAAVATVGATGSLLSACGGSETKGGVANAKLPSGIRAEGISHEACDDAGHRVEQLDANGDGKPDIRRVYDTKTNKEICRISDLNHDGRPDLFEYYDSEGQLRRREGAFDDSGVVNLIEYYEGGKLVRKELDTTGQHRIDTWDFYDPATGKRIRRERDATNDGRVDQWWTYGDGDKVTIAIDKNGDGQPDPDATVVIGGSGGPDKDAGVAAAAPLSDAGAVPLPVASADPVSPSAGPTQAPDSPSGSPRPDAGAPRRTKK